MALPTLRGHRCRCSPEPFLGAMQSPTTLSAEDSVIVEGLRGLYREHHNHATWAHVWSMCRVLLQTYPGNEYRLHVYHLVSTAPDLHALHTFLGMPTDLPGAGGAPPTHAPVVVMGAPPQPSTSAPPDSVAVDLWGHPRDLAPGAAEPPSQQQWQQQQPASAALGSSWDWRAPPPPPPPAPPRAETGTVAAVEIEIEIESTPTQQAVSPPEDEEGFFSMSHWSATARGLFGGS